MSNIITKTLPNLSNINREKILGITLHSYIDLYDKKAQYDGYLEIEKRNKETKDLGFNYLLDQYDIVETVNPKTLVDPFFNKKTTFIATKLYNDEIAKNTISICIFISKEHDYKETEKTLIKFLSELLKEYKLESKDIWRGYDLSKEDKGPIQYLDKDIFKNLLSILDDYNEFEDKDNYNFDTAFEIPDDKTYNDIINDIYKEAIENLDSYISKYEPDAKGIKDILKQEETVKVGMSTITYPTKNTLQYNINNISPGEANHCVKSFDKLNGITSNEKTMVEPIYPDLITPPGGDINIADGHSETAVQSKSDIAMSIEDFEKRQKTFNLNDYENVTKTTVGRPVNTDDPFPVDEQIKKLEEHFPKVKIDKITYDFTEDNHPGSTMGASSMKNFNMVYDILDEMSKRTEKRLVKLENNLSTVMRNLFRVSSRVNINCVYYGGQSVYGKYKCIRCLHDNRIDDGAIVTLDQCLCCTRYEPILGQVYAILDETGSNVSQVVDDLQMSYRTLNDHNNFNNVNEYYDSPQNADLSKDNTLIPKEFRETKWADTKAEKKAKDELKAKQAALNVESEETIENDSEDSKNILITYEEIKDYLDDKYKNAIITDAYDAQISIDDYIILHKYDFLPLITEKLNKEENKEYKDDNGNVITKEEYIQLLTKKFKESYVNDTYFNGFKMDWKTNLLELHKPNINSYDKEKLQQAKIADESSKHQGIISRDIFLDSRENAIEYETLEFNVKDYVINGFSGGTTIGSSTGIFGAGATEVRKKIVEYAQKVYDLCQEGKAAYSQDNRYDHDEKAINGMNYYDCSSLVEAAYKSAGVTGVSGTTYTEYPPCTDAQGGILIPIGEINSALPGDMIFFSNGDKPTTKEELQNISTNPIYHIGIYAGDGKYIHASGKNSTPNIKISNVEGAQNLLAFGRPKDLVTLDSQASSGTCDVDAWNKEKQGISEELYNKCASEVTESKVDLAINNMSKYGYKNDLLNICNEYGYDSYMIFAMAIIESEGNPNCGGSYPGLLQCENGSSDPATNLKQACSMLDERKVYLKQKGWNEQNIHCLVSAHNSGQGGVAGAASSAGISLADCDIQQLGDALYSWVPQHQPTWSAEEKRDYGTKVLIAYNYAYAKKALD